MLVMEAMKMEHSIQAPADGTVAELFFAVGDQVPEGAELVTMESWNSSFPARVKRIAGLEK